MSQDETWTSGDLVSKHSFSSSVPYFLPGNVPCLLSHGAPHPSQLCLHWSENFSSSKCRPCSPAWDPERAEHTSVGALLTGLMTWARAPLLQAPQRPPLRGAESLALHLWSSLPSCCWGGVGLGWFWAALRSCCSWQPGVPKPSSFRVIQGRFPQARHQMEKGAGLCD